MLPIQPNEDIKASIFKRPFLRKFLHVDAAERLETMHYVRPRHFDYEKINGYMAGVDGWTPIDGLTPFRVSSINALLAEAENRKEDGLGD